MSTAIKLVVVLLLLLGLLGGSAFFAYELFWKPRHEATVLNETPKVEPTPIPPHPDIAAFEAAAAALEAGRSEEARAALAAIVGGDPASPKALEARRLLGGVNSKILFSPVPSPEKTAYTVAKGDALARIASRNKSDAELIFRVNNLPNINLQIGQTLYIPTLQIVGFVDREQKILTLTNNGVFFKDYPLLGASVPGLAAGSVQEVKVGEKFASRDGKRVAFGTKDFEGCERVVLLSPGNASLRTMPEGAETPPSGLILAPSDLEEIFVLVSRGVPFTIR